MKPYKILRPKKPLWTAQTIEVSVSEKKIIKLPLKLFTKCHPMARKVSQNIRVKYEQSGNKEAI